MCGWLQELLTDELAVQIINKLILETLSGDVGTVQTINKLMLGTLTSDVGAVQIIDKPKYGRDDEDAVALTGSVTTRLRHPCIVRVLAHCVTDSAGAGGSKPWDSALSQRDGARYDNACWMLLEYCDKGTLLVRAPGASC